MKIKPVLPFMLLLSIMLPLLASCEELAVFADA